MAISSSKAPATHRAEANTRGFGAPSPLAQLIFEPLLPLPPTKLILKQQQSQFLQKLRPTLTPFPRICCSLYSKHFAWRMPV